MKRLKALVYLEGTADTEQVTVEFICWEQLYELIQAIQYNNPARRAGLEQLIDSAPQDFPLFEWQVPHGCRISKPLLKPQPLIVR